MSIAPTARDRFLEEYRIVRHSEGRGSSDSAYYRELPFSDLSGRNTAMWSMRAITFRRFLKGILQPMEKRHKRPLDVLDLGAGNCWLSYRLRQRGHSPVAVDIFSDPLDGLRAACHYPDSFPVLECDFADLPLRPESFDVAVFNASFHYAIDYEQTLQEVRRCLRPGGVVVILDTPVYRLAEHGLRMVEEKHAAFERQYGFRSDALPSREFLDLETLDRLQRTLNLRWQIEKPWYGWRWHLRPLLAKLHSRRPPSRFWLIAGRFAS